MKSTLNKKQKSLGEMAYYLAWVGTAVNWEHETPSHKKLWHRLAQAVAKEVRRRDRQAKGKGKQPHKMWAEYVTDHCLSHFSYHRRSSKAVRVEVREI